MAAVGVINALDSWAFCPIQTPPIQPRSWRLGGDWDCGPAWIDEISTLKTQLALIARTWVELCASLKVRITQENKNGQ
jgi:hypothetical protein